MGLTSGTHMLVAAVLESSSQHMDMDDSKSSFRIFPLAYFARTSHQPVINRSWMWEAKQLAGLAHSPIHQHASYYSSPEPQLPLDPTPLTRWETPTPGPPGPPSRQWAGQLQLQDPQGPTAREHRIWLPPPRYPRPCSQRSQDVASYTRRQVLSSRLLGPDPPTSRPTSAPGPQQSCSQPCQDPAYSTAGQHH